MGVALKQEKPPQSRGLLSSLAPGKKVPSETFLKTLHYRSMQEVVLPRFCY